MERAIVHLDADAFFASVEQAADVRLRGKPIAVGGEKRGIIASASYEARKMGVYTPMPTVKARKLCPKLIIVPGDFEKYERFSRWMFSYAYDFTPFVEISSIDEGYFDLTAARKPAVEVADKVRSAIKQALKINVSEGIASNKLVSQIAAKVNKPAAFAHIPSGHEIEFLHPLINRWLPGIGPKAGEKLDSAGLARIGQIAITPLEHLDLLLGKTAVQVKEYANGIDERPIIPVNNPAKSYSHQQTFNKDITDEAFIEATLRHMADSLMAKVRSDGKSIRTVTVKVRYNDMDEDQRSESLLEPTDLETDLYGRLNVLLRQAWRRRVSLRLVSLKLSNVYENGFLSELPLGSAAQQQEARRRLAGVVDELRRNKGFAVLLRGHDFRLKESPVDESQKEESRGTSKSSARKSARIQPTCAQPYVPLQVRSYYSFLNSTLSIADIVELARKYELPAIALTDTGNLHGAIEFLHLCEGSGIRPIIGAEVRVESDPAWLYVENQCGYRNLCRLLTQRTTNQGYSAGGAGLPVADLEAHADGLLVVSANPQLAQYCSDRFYPAVLPGMRPAVDKQSKRAIPILPFYYGKPEDRWKFDIVQSIRTRTLLRQEHPEKLLSGRYHFRSPKEIAEKFSQSAWLVEQAREFSERCCSDFSFLAGKPQFPEFKPPDGSSAAVYLRKLVLDGMKRRYPGSCSRTAAQIEEELNIISEVGYEEYFLAVWALLQDCKEQGIEWITRGSAADSLVCYCLGISDVCPIRFELYFRRFLNKERMSLNKLPDIDIDFPHDRKDDVVDLIFKKYGTGHTAAVGGFATYRARSAVADVAKVLGVSEHQIRRFTERIPWANADGIGELLEQSIECRDLPLQEEPYKTALEMAQILDGFPRNPKMHPCGIVISRQPMNELTPTFISNKGYPTTHFNMEAVESIGLIKMDILAQGGLAVMRDVRSSLQRKGKTIDLKTLKPWQDPEVWEMIASGGGRAVHHIESPAMVSLCRMCNVRDVDGLIAIVSVIRPGAANEQNKVRFTRLYQGLEPIEYPDKSLEPCLKSTFGLVVYEEHILQICEAFAGLPPGRADVLRRSLAKGNERTIDQIHGEFIEASRRRGHSDEKIAKVWNLVSSFVGYAFCKAHSTAYGVEAYEAAWLKYYHTAEFMAGVLSNGKGFYHPLVYILECHRLGIRLLRPWVNEPGPKFGVSGNSIRVPVIRIKGLSERTVASILREFQRQPFHSLQEFLNRVGPQKEEAELLIRAGAFDEYGTTRTAQYWEMQYFFRRFGRDRDNQQGWLFAAPGIEKLPEVPLVEPTYDQKLQWESDLLGYPVSGHPLELHNTVAWETYCSIASLHEYIGQEIVTCGLVIEQRTFHQVTGEMMKFMTIADRTGIIETELFAATYRSYGLATVRYPVLEVHAKVEPYENGRGFSLRVQRVGKPRCKE